MPEFSSKNRPLGSKDPLFEGELRNQEETKEPFGYDVSLGPKAPDFSLQRKQSGKIGSVSPVTVKPLRAPIADVSPKDMEAVAPERKKFIS